jgi:peptidoglycan hydrolase-like protein with peptidoglycan-binding domain
MEVLAMRRTHQITLSILASVLLLALPAVADAKGQRHLGQRQLLPGMRGHDVIELQLALRFVGYRTDADGDFGPHTTQMVRLFRSNAQLDPSARVNRPMVHALKRATRGGPGDIRRLGMRRLRYGMVGHDVAILQRLLTAVGHHIPDDGTFGSRTLKAVREFENETNRKVDGVVTSKDAGALGRAGLALRASQQTLTTPAATAPAATPPAAPAAPAAPPAVATVPGSQAQIVNGLAVAPADAPQAVKDVIAAGNRIATKPYIYGGGHQSFDAAGYDCSGSVSYALHGGGLLDVPKSSYDFYDWGDAGPGQWITVYANDGHAYMIVAGLRFDTTARRANGNRWTTEIRSPAGYDVRHPTGL